MSTFAEGLAALIEKYFGGSQAASAVPTVEVTKSLNEEKRMALFVVLAPQEGDTTDDLHGDTYTEEEIEKACNNFNTHCGTANIFHQVQTQEVDIVQSFIAPASFTLDNGVEVKKGTWLQWFYFPETEVGDALWEGVKSGDINGVSINAMATVEDLT
jgi:hypothetical protein